ncbi:methionine--tRNA ligase [Campylobacter coli]|uniref:Methionine--tRNA ligase n=8 Tax=Campylobacter coli TaxID=195 RepID=A0A0Q2L7C3_CAMCO|nr:MULTISPECIES: methionine--tRNA ligase [Campylobacter]EAI7421808.1 methionine--tRNA ligase [Campylobacter hyointestinalis]EIA57202.1 methionyl-tRNA synthetase [Campylobacter coli 2692]EIA69588.1 methionyl-tRNA synthetase [Campylobacter coli 7--1]EIA75278.1 methionyl-tRNA synthetase [Campylobacter coli 1891]EIB06693.1 methionyl-tRNA synthetase [Campylobacter coli H6]KDA35840.1 methionyl-tRNA synthetase [Campylobacter jejuni K5]
MRYLTTPIYYVNDVPHLGHAYTTIIADTLARFYRLQGHETRLLTGTDEHGQKIEQAAKIRNSTPKEYADKISSEFKKLWDEFEITYDIYARTTDTRHVEFVKAMFLKMWQKGDIYKDEYEGHYCISCESFFAKSQLINECGCPDCGKDTSLLKEESYFFKLSKYQDKILQWYDKEDPILPKNKKNELINFVQSGLKDLSITRTSFDWGIEIPEEIKDDKHIIYVWLDALFIYISSLDYQSQGENAKFWPAHIHLVGKDILRFHAIYWPAFLMSVDLPLPKFIGAHGWWTKEGEKMSKSKGNVVKPKEVVDAYGLEAFRYFLLREVPFGNDGDFSESVLINRINTELGNEFGNLLNRIIGMSIKYNQGNISQEGVLEFYKNELDTAKEHLDNAINFLENLQCNRYLEELFKALSVANLAISKYEPWNLIKANKIKEANALIGLCANILAKTSLLLSPTLPKSCQKVGLALNFEISPTNYQKLILQNELLDFKASACEALFPKIEKPLLSQEEKQEVKKEEKPKIKIDDFAKIEIKVAKVIDCQNIEGSEKLLKFKLELDNKEIRQVLSGIAKYYKASDLIGKQVCVISNLKKAKIFGHESDGMILSAKSGDKLVLISPEQLVENGSLVG